MDKQNYFMSVAIKEAKKGITSLHGGPFGAVIVKDNIIIARAHNCVVKNNDPTSHGEMNAIRKASKKLKTFDLSGCVIYTTGEPCPMCLGAILWANISKVYYGANYNDTEMIGFRDKKFSEFDSKDFVVELDRDKVLELYNEYNNIKERTSY
ncbi:MAG: nucleoside deaminase [Acholeplasmatales bacterium]|jgi:guanine deaminase|nr:nucleoside deaminase [Acholeplasmatales bacterium]